ncbi:MAG: 4-hydroxybenzoyl-CoA reductase subunit alpha [Alphaproteobacteria bacterium]|nr:4-hydroxybenzoyl-CoA reductase subunit alpha [Alphaproteobacteria bacterium]MBT4965291.1 4-hydroxybenzoyl-CoA reductase subunit alpha [Alphaproteobacteria bacterium]MBT5159981.1 4-hydroxybenzoyl-CoA reductase subunit alpha [Alphaproteobacteria bacterium]MBT6387705.1 4-hydroxybenzoyl-CoA reductase subunit alpha [Alphaproteobacteria bacterium]
MSDELQHPRDSVTPNDPHPDPSPNPERKVRSVGERLPLIDGPDKVTGRAKYAGDLGQDGLVGRILHGRYSHAEILSVDTSEAEALPGVVCVLTGDDTPEPFGILPIAMLEFPLANGRVRYRGEPVAAVAAIDAATAAKAISLIKVEYKELPAYYTAEDARAPDAEQLHESRTGNLERDVHFELGDTEAEFANSDLVVEESYQCAEVNQVHMEPNAAVAEYDPIRKHLTIWPSTQVPFYGHLIFARCLGLDKGQVRVIKPFVGGGFGARTETLHHEVICAHLAKATGSTVRLTTSREETFITHRGRPETQVNLKMGMNKDGKLTGLASEVVQRGGGYPSYGIVTILYAGTLMYGIYDIPAVKYDGYRVLTNTPPCGAFRGHGTVNVRFAIENLMDRMADELGLDPFEVRRKNLLDAPVYTANDIMVNSYGLPECLDWVQKESNWDERIKNLGPNKGLGMACAHYVSGAAKPVHWTGEPHAVVNLKLDFDGAVTALTGAADIGQGSSTMVVQCVAETLNLDVSQVKLMANDSDHTPKDNGSYSSRVTFMVGNAALDAARNMRQILAEAAATLLDAKPEDIEFDGTMYRVDGSQDPGIEYMDVVIEALKDEGTITAKGTFSTPVSAQGGRKYRGAAVGPTMGFSYSAEVVEVTVDPDTSQVTVDNIWIAHDLGFALNPLSCEGQIQGSAWMGMGQALSEETRYHNGLLISGNMLDYRVPTMVESPPMDIKMVESIDPNGPYGAKEAGEGSLPSFIPAMANAVKMATGVRMTETPITPDRLFEARARFEREQANKVAAE